MKTHLIYLFKFDRLFVAAYNYMYLGTGLD